MTAKEAKQASVDAGKAYLYNAEIKAMEDIRDAAKAGRTRVVLPYLGERSIETEYNLHLAGYKITRANINLGANVSSTGYVTVVSSDPLRDVPPSVVSHDMYYVLDVSWGHA